MYFVGLDVHLRHTSICILDAHGVKLRQGQLPGPWSLIAEELKTLPGSVAVCYEASCGYGDLHDLLTQVAERVVVAHPGQLRLIFRSKRKNDRADAEKLAKLLFLNEVSTGVRAVCGHPGLAATDRISHAYYRQADACEELTAKLATEPWHSATHHLRAVVEAGTSLAR